MGLTVQAPTGAHFDFEEVKTAKGTQSLGDVPILVWDDLNAAVEFYGAEGVLNIMDGTSARVSFQSIARRIKGAGKTPEGVSIDDAIAAKQLEFRPGKRQAGPVTPAGKAAKAAKAAVEKTGNADAITQLLEKFASGELSEADAMALLGK